MSGKANEYVQKIGRAIYVEARLLKGSNKFEEPLKKLAD